MNRSAIVVVTLVLLRLGLGWHFFDAGVEKLDPGFSSAGFLRGAKGPLAPMYRGMVTGPHNAAPMLQRAVNATEGDATPSAEEDLSAWLEKVESDWQSGLTRVRRLGASDEEMTSANAAAGAALADLAAYVRDDAQLAALVDVRHETWRLEQMRIAAKKDPAPFQLERLRGKESEVWGSLQPWLKAAERSDESFEAAVIEAVRGSVSPDRARLALRERSKLNRVDTAVTVVVLGSGILLFIGLFTPAAALLAAGFVLSAMATQPPWVDGANTTYFFYQLVEVAALATIAATGAGRWAGLDRLVFGRPMLIAEPSTPSNAAS